MTHPILIISRLTFLEAIRRKIAQAGLVLGLLFLIVFSFGFQYITSSIYPNGSEAQRNLMQHESYNVLSIAGLYAVTFMAVAMATLIAADTLAGEINSGTVQSIVTKPIRRSDIVIGKWLGTAGLLLGYLVLTGGGDCIKRLVADRFYCSQFVAGSILYFHGRTGRFIDCIIFWQPHIGPGDRGHSLWVIWNRIYWRLG